MSTRFKKKHSQRFNRFTLTVPKGKKEVYRNLAEEQGISLNAYINKLLEAELERAEEYKN